MVNNPILQKLVFPVLLWFFLAGSLAGVAIAMGLLTSSARTLRLLQRINRWVSTRAISDPLEAARDIDGKIKSRGRVFGAVFALAGAYSFMVLVSQAGTALSAPSLLVLLAGALRWVLILGSALAIVVGVMLALTPRALQFVEASANRWVSTQKIAEAGERPYTPLDQLVEAYPRKAGWIILALSLFAAADFALLLFGQR